ncbi:hypothetical protein D3C84_427970 [compost metagenome]
MKKLNWRTSEVIAYLEDKIQMGIATEEEEIIYQGYKWDNKVNRNTYAWKCVIREMKDLYEEKY